MICSLPMAQHLASLGYNRSEKHRWNRFNPNYLINPPKDSIKAKECFSSCVPCSQAYWRLIDVPPNNHCDDVCCLLAPSLLRGLLFIIKKEVFNR